MGSAFLMSNSASASFGCVQELDKVVREAKEAGVPCDLAAPNTAHTIFYGDAFEVEEAAVSDYSTGSN